MRPAGAVVPQLNLFLATALLAEYFFTSSISLTGLLWTKGPQMVSVLGHMGHTVPAANYSRLPSKQEAAVDTLQSNRDGCVAAKLHLPKQWPGGIWTTGCTC